MTAPLGLDAVTVRVTALLVADPVCMGKVTKATVRQIAQIVAFPEPRADGDVLAERGACLGVIEAFGRRLLTVLEDGEPFGPTAEALDLEIARLGEAARSIGLGLHRTRSTDEAS